MIDSGPCFTHLRIRDCKKFCIILLRWNIHDRKRRRCQALLGALPPARDLPQRACQSCRGHPLHRLQYVEPCPAAGFYHYHQKIMRWAGYYSGPVFHLPPLWRLGPGITVKKPFFITVKNFVSTEKLLRILKIYAIFSYKIQNKSGGKYHAKTQRKQE